MTPPFATAHCPRKQSTAFADVARASGVTMVKVSIPAIAQKAFTLLTEYIEHKRKTGEIARVRPPMVRKVEHHTAV